MYVSFKVRLLTCYCQIKEVYIHYVFVRGIELWVMYLICVFVDGVWVSSCCVAYNQDIIWYRVSITAGRSVCQGVVLCIYVHNELQAF